jgi:hypothetical protein
MNGGETEKSECVSGEIFEVLGKAAATIKPCEGAFDKPDKKHISTFYVECSNLTVSMHSRRFTRLTNGFSKKLENHAYSVALSAMYYNFCKIHKTLRITPAMEAGVSDRVWDVVDIVKLVEDAEPKPVKRGPYKKRSIA